MSADKEAMGWGYLPLYLGAAAGAFALYLDLQGAFSEGGLPLAHIEEMNGVVRHLSPGELSWDRSLAGTPLADKALVSTQGDSQARLRFASGGELILLENTTLLVSRSEGSFELKVLNERGHIRMTEELTKQVVVKKVSGKTKKVLEVDPKSVLVNKTETRVLTERLEKRFAPPLLEISDVRDPASILSQREVSQAEVLPPMPRLLGATRFKDTRETELTWKLETRPENAKAEYTFEILLRGPGGFEKTLESDELALRVAKLAPGRYEWSVRALDDDDRKSPVPGFASFEVETPPLHRDEIHFFPVKVK